MSNRTTEKPLSSPRMTNELKTIRAMIGIYCRAHHQPGTELCQECAHLLSYARKRLISCPFQDEKPTCGNCSIHCYKKDMRKTIREVMRYAGPRMIHRHPLLAFRHLLDGRRKAPPLTKKPRSTKE